MSSVKKAILSVIGNSISSPAKVVGVESINAHFKFIEIESESFKGLTLKPGEKIQVNVGDWNIRTYTPLEIDSEKGTMKILGFIHGNGPGSNWVKNVGPGEDCPLIGPRSSMNLAESVDPILIFGDETAVAMAATFKNLRKGSVVKAVFTVSPGVEIGTLLERLELDDSVVFVKSANESLESTVKDRVNGLIKELGIPWVLLAGHAQAIQEMRSNLKNNGIAMTKVKVKAYWADGKVGID